MDATHLPEKVLMHVKAWRTGKNNHLRVKVGEATLTYTEYVILMLTASGFNDRIAGTILERSARTIDHHKENIRQKLKVRTINGLTHIAIKHNLVNPGEFIQY